MLADLVDLDRHPIHQDGPARDALIARCRTDLEADGMFNLDGFFRADAIAQTLAMAAPLWEEKSFTHQRRHNIYFKKSVPGLSDDHPALKLHDTTNHTLCGDLLQDTPVATLYYDPTLAQFLSDVMETGPLYPMEDQLAAFNVMAYHAGEALNWHFDRSQFTITLLLQKPDQGGGFEYRTDLRSADDPNYDGVAKLLNGEDDGAKLMTVEAGTLNVFKGVNTAHRVTPVEGDTARIITVMTYYDHPGARFTPEEQMGFYGRTG
ncbi:2OG-Fe(II) oxygenase [uncultured Litoreibacter sp.]|uniref:HalD/BesD family halogenase n=1 Tax=uncultured Litoreibacter sp. TaxID=1392394 RepID=UPI002621EC99|nr:2OG-Fe(II) oxygenase [uncultured Litoreibacter sp.]